MSEEISGECERAFERIDGVIHTRASKEEVKNIRLAIAFLASLFVGMVAYMFGQLSVLRSDLYETSLETVSEIASLKQRVDNLYNLVDKWEPN